MTRARDVANLIGSGNYSSTTFTATAGQTAFTISHTQGFVQVFMNGLLLDETVDYTSNGSAVTLTSGAAAGDEIEVVAYNTFSVGDALPKSGGTMTGALTVSGSNGELLNVSSTTGSELAVYVDGNEISFRADADNDDNNTVMTFDLDGSEKIRITNDGLHIGGTGSANAIDDYEEGTWTANLQAPPSGITNSAATSSLNRYTKIGNVVFVQGVLSINNDSSSAAIVINGLPFTSASATGAAGGQISRYSNGLMYSPYIGQNSSQVMFYVSNNTGNWDSLQYNEVSSAYFHYNIYYSTDA